MKMSTIPVYTKLARLLGWEPTGEEWIARRDDQIASLLNTAPTGSGICFFEMSDASKPGRIVFSFSYHHDDDENPRAYGYTDHKIKLYPCPMHTFDLRITGYEADRKTYGTLDYLAETFHSWLSSHVEEHAENLEQSFYDIMERSFRPAPVERIW
jgi:hypothetical protein